MADHKRILIGDEYDESKWKKIARHSDHEVFGFFGKFQFLSNFYPTSVLYEGVLYPSVEHAYQAAKFIESARTAFLAITAGQAKRLGQSKENRKYSELEWQIKKLLTMREVVHSKFLRNLALRGLLIETSDKILTEANWWGDTYFGVYIPPEGKAKGENHLGEILMKERSVFSDPSCIL